MVRRGCFPEPHAIVPYVRFKFADSEFTVIVSIRVGSQSCPIRSWRSSSFASGTTVDAHVSACSLTVAPECITAFNELKLNRGASAIKFIIYALSPDFKSIVVEEKSSEKDYEVFYNKLVSPPMGGMT